MSEMYNRVIEVYCYSLGKLLSSLCYMTHNYILLIKGNFLFMIGVNLFDNFSEPINIFQAVYATDNAPIRLSYHGGTHYNSLVDPYKATVGVGLGLPEFHPGMADRNLMKEATRQSENLHIEQVNEMKGLANFIIQHKL